MFTPLDLLKLHLDLTQAVCCYQLQQKIDACAESIRSKVILMNDG